MRHSLFANATLNLKNKGQKLQPHNNNWLVYLLILPQNSNKNGQMRHLCNTKKLKSS